MLWVSVACVFVLSLPLHRPHKLANATHRQFRTPPSQATTEDGEVFRFSLDEGDEHASWIQALLKSLRQVQQTTETFAKLIAHQTGGGATAGTVEVSEKRKSF